MNTLSAPTATAIANRGTVNRHTGTRSTGTRNTAHSTMEIPMAPGVRREVQRAPAPCRSTTQHWTTRRSNGVRPLDRSLMDRRQRDRRQMDRLQTDRRPVDRRPRHPGAGLVPVIGGTRCATPTGERRHTHRAVGRTSSLVAVLTGVTLAVLVWLVAVAGSDYQESATPTPAATQVVHARAGESLSAIAARVAPDMPRQVVIDEIVALNDMSGSGLTLGQALLAPAYR